MENWKRLAEECEELLRQHDAAKTDGLRIVLLAMAARKFDQAASLKRANA